MQLIVQLLGPGPLEVRCVVQLLLVCICVALAAGHYSVNSDSGRLSRLLLDEDGLPMLGPGGRPLEVSCSLFNLHMFLCGFGSRPLKC
jgi:hypothetical protein